MITEGIHIIVPGLNDTGDNKIYLKANVLIAKNLLEKTKPLAKQTSLQSLQSKPCPPLFLNSAKSQQDLSRANITTVNKTTKNLASCISNLTKTQSSEKIGAIASTTEKCSILNNLNTLVVDEQKYHHIDVLDTKTDSNFPDFGKLNNFYPIREFDDKDQECLIDFDQTILDDIEDKVLLNTIIKDQSKNINLNQNYHNTTSVNNLEDEEFNFKMENFSADFDSSSIFGGCFMDELMLPNFLTDDFTTSLPIVYDFNEQQSTIKYIDPMTTQDDNIPNDFTTMENVCETNEIYHNDQAINISEDNSPNLYLNDMIIDNNILLTSNNNNNNHYNNNNMMVPEELNHISESTQQNSDAVFTLKPLKIAAIKDDFNNNTISLTTPDIANQIFDLESNNIVLEDEQPELNFDLIEFITSPNNDTMTSFDDDIQEPPTPVKMTTKRKYSEYRETSSTCSSVGSPAPSSSKKRRGRPPKPLDEIPEIPVDNLNETDIKYFEMRNKNNLASRRSRMNRKHRELKDEVESNKLEDEYRKLVEIESQLIKDCEKWKRAVMRLAAL